MRHFSSLPTGLLAVGLALGVCVAASPLPAAADATAIGGTPGAADAAPTAAGVATAGATAAPASEGIPEKAVCRVCELRGSLHGEEKVAAWRDFEGSRYFFCSKPCAESFDGFPEAYVPPVLPRPAPGFEIATTDGGSMSLADLEGRVVLVDFWATWCKPCVQAMPDLQKLHEEWGSQGVSVVGISIDQKSPEDIRKFAKKKKLGYAIGLDGGDDPAWQSYRVAAIPAVFLIDASGRIVRQWTGRVDQGEVSAAVRVALEAAKERAG